MFTKSQVSGLDLYHFTMTGRKTMLMKWLK